MDPVLIAMLVLQLALGGLLGVVAWTVRDMRGDQRRRLEQLEGKVSGIQVALAGEYVTKGDCRDEHREVEAKIGDLDRSRRRVDVALSKVAEAG